MRLVVPTSRSTAPDCAMTSGTRNPPPISTSSPREMRTSRPAASAASASSVAAALLLTTTAASAPVSRQIRRSACTSRRPRAPRRGRIRGWYSRRRARDARRAAWRQRRAAEIRVDDHAGRVDDARRATARSRRSRAPRHARWSLPTSSERRFDRLGRRRRQRRRTAASAAARPRRRRGRTVASSARMASRCRSCSIDGILGIETSLP